MTDAKKRVMIAGLLALCIAKLALPDRYGDMGKVIGLSELIALSGAWCCSVWLWPIAFASGQPSSRWLRSVQFGKIFAWLCFGLAIGAGGFGAYSFSEWYAAKHALLSSTSEKAGIFSDWKACFLDPLKWRDGLSWSDREGLDRLLQYDTDKSVGLQRVLSIAYVAEQTGHDAFEVSKRFEDYYMQAFAKSQHGLNLPNGVKDSSDFFTHLKARFQAEEIDLRDRERERVRQLRGSFP